MVKTGVAGDFDDGQAEEGQIAADIESAGAVAGGEGGTRVYDDTSSNRSVAAEGAAGGDRYGAGASAAASGVVVEVDAVTIAEGGAVRADVVFESTVVVDPDRAAVDREQAGAEGAVVLGGEDSLVENGAAALGGGAGGQVQRGRIIRCTGVDRGGPVLAVGIVDRRLGECAGAD